MFQTLLVWYWWG